MLILRGTRGELASSLSLLSDTTFCVSLSETVKLSLSLTELQTLVSKLVSADAVHEIMLSSQEVTKAPVSVVSVTLRFKGSDRHDRCLDIIAVFNQYGIGFRDCRKVKPRCYTIECDEDQFRRSREAIVTHLQVSGLTLVLVLKRHEQEILKLEG